MTKVDDGVFWQMVGMRRAKKSIQWIAKELDLSPRCVSMNLALGDPRRRQKKKRKPSPAVKKRRLLVEKLLTKRVIVEEVGPPTLNKNGTVRKNSRVKRCQTRHPTGSLSRTRRALAVDHGIRVSRSQVHRDKNACGLFARRRPKGPERYVGDEYLRLKYCKDNLEFAKKNAGKVIFVDEKQFDSMDSDVYAYTKNAKERAPARERNRFPPRVHVFGAVAKGFRFLHVFGKNERITADVYRKKCLEPLLGQLKKKGRWLLHDGAGAHKGTLKWLAENGVKVVVHPARSPDLNPVERAWSNAALRVSMEGPMLDDKLREFVKKCWKAIPQKSVNKTCLAWPRMMEAVIALKGATSCKNLPKIPPM